MLRILGAVALAAVVSLCAPAFGQSCVAPAEVELRLTANGVAETVRHHREADARVLLAAYNRIPPATTHQADLVLIVPVRGWAVERIFIFDKGCLVDWGDLERGWAVRQLGEGA